MKTAKRDFDSVKVEDPISKSNHMDYWTLGKLYGRAAQSNVENKGNTPDFQIYAMLADICRVNFTPENSNRPYGPMCVDSNGRRTLVPEDLSATQLDAIADIVPDISNPALRARLADIVWLSDKQKQSPMARQAIASYIEAIKMVLEGKAILFGSRGQYASCRDGCQMLRRACQVAKATGWKEPEGSQVKSLVELVARDCHNRCEPREFCEVACVWLECELGNSICIAKLAEDLAHTPGIDPLYVRDLWKIAATAYGLSKDFEERDRCNLSAAESCVIIANNVDAMAKPAWLATAIDELGNHQDTHKRREEIKIELNRSQLSIGTKFSSKSLDVDLTDQFERVQQHVSGQTLADALKEFAALTESPNPVQLRDLVKTSAHKDPLWADMYMVAVDDEGKPVAKAGGLTTDEAESDPAIRLRIEIGLERLRRHIDVMGLIEPATKIISTEHDPQSDDFLPLFAASNFVPEDRVDVFSQGFSKYFEGDRLSALHILVPQLENAIRNVLRQSGLEPSVFRGDGTQSNLTLSGLLERPQSQARLNHIFGSNLMFDIDNVFNYGGGPRIRHAIAHGLMSTQACAAVSSTYACWLILHLCYRPMLEDHNEARTVLAGD